MTDNRLMCTGCDSLVIAGLDYDGYHGRCGCQSYYFTVGSGDRPRTWSRVDDASDPGGFRVTLEGMYVGTQIADSDHVLCLKCKQSESVTVSVEHVDVAGFDRKARFKCVNAEEHVPLAGTGYYSSNSGKGKALAELANSEVES